MASLQRVAPDHEACPFYALNRAKIIDQVMLLIILLYMDIWLNLQKEPTSLKILQSTKNILHIVDLALVECKLDIGVWPWQIRNVVYVRFNAVLDLTHILV